MKTFSSILPILVAFILGLTASSQGQSLQSVYNDGVTLFQQGDYVNALQKFEQVLRAKPGYIYARNYAGKCRAEIAKGAGPKNDTEAQIAQIIIPELNLTEAPIGDVLTYLSDRARELSGGKLAPNFIYQGTVEQRQNITITLSLRNVPMTEAIRYVGQLSRTDFRYDAHAIVATPRISQPVAPAPTASQSSTDSEFDPSGSIFD